MSVLLSAFSINVFSGSLPLYLYRSRGFSVDAIGVLVGIAFVVQLLATLLVGPLVDRRGARLAVRLGSGCYLLAALLFLLNGTGVLIGTARILQGLGFALVVPAAYSMVPNLVTPRFRGTAMGGFGAFLNVALAAGPPLGLWLLRQSPTALFAAAVVAATLGLAVSWMLGPEPSADRRVGLFTYDARWTPLLALTFLTVVYWGVVTAYLPIEVPREQVTAVGWFFTADAVAVLVCRIPAGFFTDRYGARWLFLGGIGLTAAAVLLLLAPASLGILVLAGIGTGAGAALLFPPTLVELSNRSHDRNRGTAMALFSTSFAAAIGVGSLAGAPIVQRFGFGAAIVLSALVCLAAAPLVLATIHENR